MIKIDHLLIYSLIIGIAYFSDRQTFRLSYILGKSNDIQRSFGILILDMNQVNA